MLSSLVTEFPFNLLRSDGFTGITQESKSARRGGWDEQPPHGNHSCEGKGAEEGPGPPDSKEWCAFRPSLRSWCARYFAARDLAKCAGVATALGIRHAGARATGRLSGERGPEGKAKLPR